MKPGVSSRASGSVVIPVGGKVTLSLGQTAVVIAAPTDGHTFSVAVTTSSWTHRYTKNVTAAVPTISGTPRVGARLTATTGAWTSGTTFSYRWKANGTAIAGATAARLTLKPTELGKTITVTVTGCKAGYESAEATSTPTRAVAAGVLAARTPTIKGKAKVAKKLRAVTDAWALGTSYTYQWFQGRKAIKRATKVTLKLKPALRGKKVSVRVTGHEAGYAASSATSKKVRVKAGKLTAKKPKIKGHAVVVQRSRPSTGSGPRARRSRTAGTRAVTRSRRPRLPFCGSRTRSRRRRSRSRSPAANPATPPRPPPRSRPKR